MSSKGQVVIPAWAREGLALRPGDEMTVEIDPHEPGTIILQVRRIRNVDRVLEAGSRWLGATGRDLVEELHATRRTERARERRRST
jgi:AbrB family looped-hinge helix DNA binding protein